MPKSTATTELLNRLDNVFKTLTEMPTAGVLSGAVPYVSAEDVKAGILRNGLAISSFVIIEDFFKNRTGEIIEGLNNSTLPFTSFHDELKTAVTIEALDGINFRANNLKRGGEDYISFIQDETKKISSSKLAKYRFSKYSLGWNRSNIQITDITNWMSIFRVKGGWNTIGRITGKSENVLHGPDNILKLAAVRRHKAAHTPSAESPLADLIQFTKDARALALAYDAVLTKSLVELNRPNPDVLSGIYKIDDSDINFRFIINSGTHWEEFSPAARTISVQSNTNLNTVIRNAKPRALANNEILLIKDVGSKIVKWIHPY